MAKTKADAVKPSKLSHLARKWEKLPVIRSRIRKGMEWVRLQQAENSDLVICTKALQVNYQALLTILDVYGLQSQPVEDLTKQAWFFKSPEKGKVEQKRVFFLWWQIHSSVLPSGWGFA